MKCRVLVVRKDGVWFAGKTHLEEKHEDAKIFDDINTLLDDLRSLIMLATSPVLQIRIIGEEGDSV